MQYIFEQLKIKRHLVIVVAEGAGSGVRDLGKLKEGGERDQSGNVKLPVVILLSRILGCFSRQKSFDIAKKKEYSQH